MHTHTPNSHNCSIETPNLRLRHFTLNDTANYHNILNNPHVSKWLGRENGFTLAEAELWIKGMGFWKKKHGYAPWAVILKSNNQLIGHCGLKFAETFHETELMYAIHPNYSSKGYITEASNHAINYGFNTLQLNKIISFTLPNNKASRRVMEKIGMVFMKEVIHANMSHVLYKKEA